MRYEIWNLIKFVPQKQVVLYNKSKFKHLIDVSILLFNINITHLYCRKLKKKQHFEEGNS